MCIHPRYASDDALRNIESDTTLANVEFQPDINFTIETCIYRNYLCISRTFYQFLTQIIGMRLICKVQVLSGLITNCNHKLLSRWSHINSETSGCGAKQAFQRHNETKMDGLDVYRRQ